MQINWNWLEELRDHRVKSAREQREGMLESLKEQEIRALQGEYRRLLKELVADIKINWSIPSQVPTWNVVRSKFCHLWREIYVFGLFDLLKEEEAVQADLKLFALSIHPDFERNTIVLVYNSLGLVYNIEITLGFILLR